MNMKKMKLGWKVGAIISLLLVLTLGTIGISYAANGNPNPANKSLCTFAWVESNDNGSAASRGGYNPVDPGDNSSDPNQPQAPGAPCSRYSGNMGSTTTILVPETITINVNNAYPGYNPTVFFGLSNQWPTPGIVESITIDKTPKDSSELEVTLSGISLNQVIDKGKVAVGALSIGIGTSGQEVPMGKTYTFKVRIIVTQWVHRGTLQVSTDILPDGETGIYYSQPLAASGGTAPYTWSITKGALPAGLTLNSSNGLINGIPATTGTFSFTAMVTDSTGDTDNSKNLTIKINPAPAITTSSLPNGNKDRNYSRTLAASGGIQPYTWSIVSGALPAGLSLNSTTGTISGKPAVTGTFTFTVRVTDNVGGTATRSLSLRINP
jgi:hypothetical protein